jgi:hypothetical protein
MIRRCLICGTKIRVTGKCWARLYCYSDECARERERRCKKRQKLAQALRRRAALTKNKAW